MIQSYHITPITFFRSIYCATSNQDIFNFFFFESNQMPEMARKRLLKRCISTDFLSTKEIAYLEKYIRYIISIPSPPHANKRMTVTQQMYTFLIAYLIICVSIWMCVCVCVCVCVCLCVCVCMCVSPYRPFTFPHRCAHMCPWQRFLPPTKQPIT